MVKTARLAIMLGLGAAGIGAMLAIHARHVYAPVRGEAFAYIRQYVFAPTTPYSRDLGQPLGIKDLGCERLFRTYSTLGDALGGKNEQMVAVCHVDVQFEQRDAVIAINMSRAIDKPGQWHVYKFDIASNRR